MPFASDTATFLSTDGRSVTLTEPLIFVSLERGATTTVPAGFASDGTSTPRAVWDILPPFGKYWRAAILHDYLYRETWLDQETCDGIFLEAMESLGVSRLERAAIYAGVRLGGHLPFDQDRKLLGQRKR